MGSAEDTTNYTPLPRTSEDTIRAHSPEDPLLVPSIAPSSPISAHLPINTSSSSSPPSCTFPISPLQILRTISTILAFTSFLLFILPGERTFLGAAILLMHIVAFNLLYILRFLPLSPNYKLSVEFRAGFTSPSIENRNRNKNGKTVSRWSCVIFPFLDLLLALSLCAALSVSMASSRDYRWRPRTYTPGTIIAWVVAGLQFFLAFAALLKRCIKRDLILTAQISIIKAPIVPLTAVQHTVGFGQEGRHGRVQESLF